MFNSNKRIATYSIVFFGLFITFLPVILSSNYLRQDDLIMWEIWPGMKLTDTNLFFYNTVNQLVRPLCMLTYFITDLISIDIHNAVYVRFLSVITLGIMGVLLYCWQLKFNSNRLLAATFAICAFTLPPYQLFAATQNYFLILLGLLLTFGAMFFWYASYYAKLPIKCVYFWIANLLFFASCLEYPLSSMYAWVLLCICCINNQEPAESIQKRNFFNFGFLMTFVMMIIYYICILAVHKFFPVPYDNFRSAVIDESHIFSRFLKIFSVMSWHSNMWLWKSFTTWKDSPILVISVLYVFSLIKINSENSYLNARQILKKILITLTITFTLFFISYLPVLATPELGFTFRYAIATMPMLLYISFWSAAAISKVISSFIFICLTIFGIAYANLMLGDGIVGPHEHDFEYIQQQLAEKALPLLKQHKKIILHLIDCDNGMAKLYPGKTPADFLKYMDVLRTHYHFPANIPTAFEYSMRTCEFLQLTLSATIHSLNLFGYPSNYNRPNDVIWNDQEIIVKNTPWGDLIVNGVDEPHLAQLKYSPNNTPTVVTIDMRAEPVYQHMEFYKHLLTQLTLKHVNSKKKIM